MKKEVVNVWVKKKDYRLKQRGFLADVTYWEKEELKNNVEYYKGQFILEVPRTRENFSEETFDNYVNEIAEATSVNFITQLRELIFSDVRK